MRTDIKQKSIEDVLKKTEFNYYVIVKVNEGVSTDVYKLQKKNDTFYLRIVPEDEIIATQVLVHKELKKFGVKVPEVVYSTENNTEFDERSFMIVNEIKGGSLKSTKKDLSKVMKEEILFEAGRQLVLINTLKVKGVGSIYNVENGVLIASDESYNGFVINPLINKLQELEDVNILTHSQSSKILKYVQNNKDPFDITRESYLAHGDFGIDHIYQLNGEYTGIIDFGDIKGSTKFHDLAHVYTSNKEYFSILVKGYNEIYRLPSDYIKRCELEAVVFGVKSLVWCSKDNPNQLANHPALNLLETLCF